MIGGSVIIPTSSLGSTKYIGTVVAHWANTIQVVFVYEDGSEHLGQYTISKHEIIHV